MAAFSAEQQLLRFQAQNDPSCEPYPLNVPVSWAASSDNGGNEPEPRPSETATSQDMVSPVGPLTGPTGEPRPSETTTSQDMGSPVGSLTGPTGVADHAGLISSIQELLHVPDGTVDNLPDFPPSPPPASVLFGVHELQGSDLEPGPEHVAEWSPASLAVSSQHAPHAQDEAMEEAQYYRQVAETEDGLDFSELDERLRLLDHGVPPAALGPKSPPIAMLGRNVPEPSHSVDMPCLGSEMDQANCSQEATGGWVGAIG